MLSNVIVDINLKPTNRDTNCNPPMTLLTKVEIPDDYKFSSEGSPVGGRGGFNCGVWYCLACSSKCRLGYNVKEYQTLSYRVNLAV